MRGRPRRYRKARRREDAPFASDAFVDGDAVPKAPKMDRPMPPPPSAEPVPLAPPPIADVQSEVLLPPYPMRPVKLAPPPPAPPIASARPPMRAAAPMKPARPHPGSAYGMPTLWNALSQGFSRQQWGVLIDALVMKRLKGNKDDAVRRLIDAFKVGLNDFRTGGMLNAQSTIASTTKPHDIVRFMAKRQSRGGFGLAADEASIMGVLYALQASGGRLAVEDSSDFMHGLIAVARSRDSVPDLRAAEQTPLMNFLGRISRQLEHGQPALHDVAVAAHLLRFHRQIAGAADGDAHAAILKSICDGEYRDARARLRDLVVDGIGTTDEAARRLQIDVLHCVTKILIASLVHKEVGVDGHHATIDAPGSILAEAKASLEEGVELLDRHDAALRFNELLQYARHVSDDVEEGQAVHNLIDLLSERLGSRAVIGARFFTMMETYWQAKYDRWLKRDGAIRYVDGRHLTDDMAYPALFKEASAAHGAGDWDRIRKIADAIDPATIPYYAPHLKGWEQSALMGLHAFARAKLYQHAAEGILKDDPVDAYVALTTGDGALGSIQLAGIRFQEAGMPQPIINYALSMQVAIGLKINMLAGMIQGK